jgi:hypothetical protein
VTVVALGAGGYFGWQTKSDIDDMHRLQANSLDHPWSDFQAAQDRANRDLLITQIAATTAGVAAVATILLYTTRPHLVKEHAEVSAVPMRGGGAIVLGGHF